jgi:hypothetical protein
MESGTLKYMESGTLKSMEGGTLKSMYGGTLEYMKGGTLEKQSGMAVLFNGFKIIVADKRFEIQIVEAAKT